MRDLNEVADLRCFMNMFPFVQPSGFHFTCIAPCRLEIPRSPRTSETTKKVSSKEQVVRQELQKTVQEVASAAVCT